MTHSPNMPTSGKPYDILTGQPYAGQTNVDDFHSDGDCEIDVHL